MNTIDDQNNELCEISVVLDMFLETNTKSRETGVPNMATDTVEPQSHAVLVFRRLLGIVIGDEKYTKIR